MNPNSSKIVSFSNLYKSGEKKYSQTINLESTNEKNKTKLVSLEDKSGLFFEVRSSGKNGYKVEIQFDRLESLSDEQLKALGVTDREIAKQKGKVSLPIENINIIDSTQNGTDKGFQIVLKGGVEIRSNARGVEIKKAGQPTPILRTKPQLADDTFSITITETCVQHALDNGDKKVAFSSIRKDGHMVSLQEDVSAFTPALISSLWKINNTEELSENTQSTINMGNISILRANVAGFGGDSSTPVKISNNITLVKQDDRAFIYHNGAFVEIDYVHAYNYPKKQGVPSLNAQIVVKPKSKSRESFRIPLAIELGPKAPKTKSSSYILLNDIADFLGVGKVKEPSNRDNLISVGRLKSEPASVFANKVGIINTAMRNRSLNLDEFESSSDRDQILEPPIADTEIIYEPSDANAETNQQDQQSSEIIETFESSSTSSPPVNENDFTFSYDIETEPSNFSVEPPVNPLEHDQEISTSRTNMPMPENHTALNLNESTSDTPQIEPGVTHDPMTELNPTPKPEVPSSAEKPAKPTSPKPIPPETKPSSTEETATNEGTSSKKEEHVKAAINAAKADKADQLNEENKPQEKPKNIKKTRYWPKILSAFGGFTILAGFVVAIAFGLTGFGLAIGGALMGVGVAANIVGKAIPLEYERKEQRLLRYAEKFTDSELKRFKQLNNFLNRESKKFFKRDDKIKQIKKTQIELREKIYEILKKPKSERKRKEKRLVKKYYKNQKKINSLKNKQRKVIAYSKPKIIDKLKNEYVTRKIVEFKKHSKENPARTFADEKAFEFVDEYKYDIVHCLSRNTGKRSAKKAIQKMSIAERCVIEEADHNFNDALNKANAKYNPATISSSQLISFGPQEKEILGNSISKYFTSGNFTKRQEKLGAGKKAKVRRVNHRDVVLAESISKTNSWVGTFCDDLTSLELQKNAIDGLLEDDKKLLEKADELLSSRGRDYLSKEKRTTLEKNLESVSSLSEEDKKKEKEALDNAEKKLSDGSKEAKKAQKLRTSDIARGR